MTRALFLALLLSLAASYLYAQKNHNDAPREIPTVPLKYGEPQKTALFLPSTALGFPFHCADDGSIVFHASVFALETNVPPSISAFSVKPESGATPVRFDANASGLRSISSGSVAVSASRLGMIVSATTSEDETKHNQKPPRHNYLLLFDRSGSFLRTTPLPELSLERGSGVGIFDSGEVLIVAGSSGSRSGRRWMVMNEDGSNQRPLAPDEAEMNEMKKTEGKSRVAAKNGAVGTLQIIPHRALLLVMETHTRGPIFEVSPSGNIRAVELKLPEGESLGQFIPSDGATWKVILGHSDTAPSALGHFKLDKIAEFDPDTGELQRYIDPGKDHRLTSFACEERGEFLAVHTDPHDGAVVVTIGTPGH